MKQLFVCHLHSYVLVCSQTLLHFFVFVSVLEGQSDV
jgi:hypothetical protein